MREPKKTKEVKASVFNEVKRIIAGVIVCDETSITKKTSLIDDLNADLFDILEIFIEAEFKYNIEITYENYVKFETVGDLVKYIDFTIKRKGV